MSKGPCHAGPRLALVIGAFVVTVLMATPVSATQSAAAGAGSSPPAKPSQVLVNTGFASETGAAFGGLPVGPVAGSTVTTVVIGIDVNNPAALLQLDAALSDPQSPLYAHFLTQSEFVQEFGAPSSVIDGLASYLTSMGLTVTYESPDHIAMFASGTLTEVGNAFDVGFETYRDSSGTTFWSTERAPSLPPSYAGWVISIAGLTNHVSDNKVQIMAGGIKPAASQGEGVLVDPIDHHQIYQVDQLYNATGNATAGVQASYATGAVITQSLWSAGAADCGYDLNDMIKLFNNSDGYNGGTFPKPILEPHYRVPGYVTTGPEANTCADGELTIDIQHSGVDGAGATLAPTWVLGASNGGVTDAALEAGIAWIVANIPGLTVITQSWGGGEGGAGSTFQVDFENAFATAISNGVTVMASSADDDGALGNGGCPSSGTPGVFFPGSSPLALSVGGTAINQIGSSPATDDASASVWNWCGALNNPGGSQGGVSADYAEPSWGFGYNVNSSMQSAITYTTGHGGSAYSAHSAREVPDWAGPGACNTFYEDGAWYATSSCAIGGTSFSSPSTAGVVAEMAAFDGHDFGDINTALYQIENTYLKGGPVLDPSFEIQNYSNLFFGGANHFNASAGWGMPLAYNLAQDLGKPFIATNPVSEPETGYNYAVTATVKDIQAVSSVSVAYLPPGGTGSNWVNVSLTKSGGTSTAGTWTGNIPGTSLTETGDLKYCVYAIDVNSGNSWSPYNKSAWVATGKESPPNSFGCTVPFVTYVKPGPLGSGAITANRTACEVGCGVAFNATFIPGTGPFTTTFMWNDGAGDKTSVSGASPVFQTHRYTLTGTFTVRAIVNDSAAGSVQETAIVTVYPALTLLPAPSSWHGGTPGNLTFAAGVSGGSGSITSYSWTFTGPVGYPTNTSTSASPQQYYYRPGNFTATLVVVDSLSYHMGYTSVFSVWGNHSTAITLYTGWNFIALPTQSNDYTLYELSMQVGAPFVQIQDVHDTATTTYDRISGSGNNGNGNAGALAGDALWVDVSAGTTLTVFGQPGATLAGEGYTANAWSSIGWSVTTPTTAAGLASMITGAKYVSIWDAQTQSWTTYVNSFSIAAYGFTIQAGQAVQVWAKSSGTFTE
jgi:hypothetical protein